MLTQDFKFYSTYGNILSINRSIIIGIHFFPFFSPKFVLRKPGRQFLHTVSNNDDIAIKDTILYIQLIIIMVKKKNKDQTVQETNDSSILSKASIVELGYFNDPFLKLFTTKAVRRAPLIHRGYYVRSKAIDYVLTSFLRLFKGVDKIQIISLGCGFDSTYFRLKAESKLKNCYYYGVDFPEVVQRKQLLIQKQNSLLELIGNYQIKDNALSSNDYKLLPCDLTEFDKLENLFIDHDINFDAPTLLFSECVLTYVEYEKSKDILKWIKRMFLNSIVLLYEQFNPNDAFGQIMLRHFKKIQSPLQRIMNVDTITKHIELFQALHYDCVVGIDMNFFYEKYLENKEKCRMCKLEIFDEYEEWHLKCSHYCIVSAFQGK